MISDYVKGKKQFDYPEEVQTGISLHRFIDGYTDTHEATKKAKEIFKPAYRLYSGAVVDVVYDHFLASDNSTFTDTSLLEFSRWVYSTLDTQTSLMPERFARMYPYMKEQNWLYHYHSMDGAGKSLGGLVRRSAYLTESDTALQLLQQHYDELGDCYRHFWAEAQPAVKKRLEEMQNERRNSV
ncbi:MAG: DUF479 domain-containing protein [Chitinophagaceae bacterium]|nr:DUF479 domain-containing protein [Chitinophagaceae bacterium]